MFGKTTYIIAVSGGVDSVVLLDMIMSKRNDDHIYVVAHYDHGIRENSHEDAAFVKELAATYGVDCVVGNGRLGPVTSEAIAREARYAFLREQAKKFKAEKIITAHHQDDFLETIILNLLRGSGIRGLLPMQGYEDMLRPLLHKTKDELVEYAKTNQLVWREDHTNEDTRYKRNYVRLKILPRIKHVELDLLRMSNEMGERVHEIDMRLQLLVPKRNILNRGSFVLLPYLVQKEVIRAWLVKLSIPYDRRLIEQACVAVKTLPVHKKIPLAKDLWLVSEKENIIITSQKDY